MLFSLMYPGDFILGDWLGFAGFGLNPGENWNTPSYNVGYTYYTDFIFQAMFVQLQQLLSRCSC